MSDDMTNTKSGAGADSSPLPGSASLTLTQREIRDLAKFCGMILQEPTPAEAEDEKETEVTVSTWPERWRGITVQDDDGYNVEPHKHIAYLEEYPEEGFVPLGEPNVQGHRPSEPGATAAQAGGVTGGEGFDAPAGSIF